MHILIGLAAAVALLYFWLVGHWFARVLVFLMLVVLTGFCGGALFASIAVKQAETASFVIGAILGAPLAWPLASIPIWRKNSIFLRGLAMLYPQADPAELRKYARDVYGRG
jgi:hypothetical protein